MRHFIHDAPSEVLASLKIALVHFYPSRQIKWPSPPEVLVPTCLSVNFRKLERQLDDIFMRVLIHIVAIFHRFFCLIFTFVTIKYSGAASIFSVLQGFSRLITLKFHPFFLSPWLRSSDDNRGRVENDCHCFAWQEKKQDSTVCPDLHLIPKSRTTEYHQNYPDRICDCWTSTTNPTMARHSVSTINSPY
jgi:hypothetical protein